MKRIDTSSITDTARMPFAAKSLSFLQDSYKEVVDAIVQGMINYTSGTVVVLYGCQVTGTSPNFSVSAGAIYYNNGSSPIGEIYLVYAGTVTTTGSQIPVWTMQTLNTAQYNSINVDPVLFTDNSPHSIHDINEFVLTAGASGSGIADYTNVTYYNPVRFAKAIGEIFPYYGSVSAFSGGLGSGQWTGFALCDGNNGTPNLCGRVIIGTGTVTDINGTSQVFTYNTNGGELSHKLTSAESGIRDHIHDNGVAASGSGGGPGGTNSGNTGSSQYQTDGIINVDGVSGRNGAQDASSAHNNVQPYYVLYYIMRIA